MTVIYQITKPDGSIWGEEFFTKYDAAKRKMVTFWLPDPVAKHVTYADVDCLCQAYFLAGYRIKELLLAGDA